MPRRATVVVLVVTLVALGLASPAGAADDWHRRAAPSPVPKNTMLMDVDCVSTTDCTAVGMYFIHHQMKSQALVVRTTDGVHWTRPTVGVPTQLFSQLYGVSCTSPTSCTAVGFSVSNGPFVQEALVIRTTDGATWTRVPARPGGLPRRFIDLHAVDCVTATHCRAVGSYPEARKPMILRTTNDADWYRQVTPLPGGGASELWGIDCSTDQECTAVGNAETSPAHGGSLVLRTTDGTS